MFQVGLAERAFASKVMDAPRTWEKLRVSAELAEVRKHQGGAAARCAGRLLFTVATSLLSLPGSQGPSDLGTAPAFPLMSHAAPYAALYQNVSGTHAFGSVHLFGQLLSLKWLIFGWLRDFIS